MLVAFLCLQNGWNSPQKTFSYIINTYFKISKTLNKVYDDFKDWIIFFSDILKFGIFYVFKVGIIIITFKFLFIRNNIFFSKKNLNFLQVFCCLHFFVKFALFVFHFSFNKNCIVKSFEIKNKSWLGMPMAWSLFI